MSTGVLEAPAMGGAENRREPRYAVRLPATLLRGKREPVRLETVDVSVHGLYLRTAEPPPMRQLVKVELRLPPDGRAIVLHGMIVFVRKEPEGDVPAGVGLSLVGLDGALLSAWDDFVRSLSPRHSGSLRRLEEAALAETQRPDRRRLERRGNELRLVFRSVGDLVALADGEVAEPERFVATDMPLPVGMRLTVLLEHPATHATFALDALVRRRAREEGINGVALDFAALDAARRGAFIAFVSDDAEELGDDDIELE
jgi:hypothetical protein